MPTLKQLEARAVQAVPGYIINTHLFAPSNVDLARRQLLITYSRQHVAPSRERQSYLIVTYQSSLLDYTSRDKSPLHRLGCL